MAKLSNIETRNLIALRDYIVEKYKEAGHGQLLTSNLARLIEHGTTNAPPVEAFSHETAERDEAPTVETINANLLALAKERVEVGDLIEKWAAAPTPESFEIMDEIVNFTNHTDAKATIAAAEMFNSIPAEDYQGPGDFEELAAHIASYDEAEPEQKAVEFATPPSRWPHGL